MTIQSHGTDQHHILRDIRNLHCDGVYDADISYGSGSFYKHDAPPLIKYDIAPKLEFVTEASSSNMPLEDSSLNSIVFDPPFLCHIKKDCVMGKRFSGYWNYSELVEHYQETLEECSRVLKKKGVLVFKCQDIIHNHKMHCTHAKVIGWAEERGFRILDLFVLSAKNRMPVKAHKTTPQKQQHARVHQSFFLVFKKL